jgi:hypothetical protein
VAIGPIWRPRFEPGGGSKGGGRHYYFPSKNYTFTVYDRARIRFLYWLGVTIIPIILLILVFSSSLLNGYRLAALT